MDNVIEELKALIEKIDSYSMDQSYFAKIELQKAIALIKELQQVDDFSKGLQIKVIKADIDFVDYYIGRKFSAKENIVFKKHIKSSIGRIESLIISATM